MDTHPDPQPNADARTRFFAALGDPIRFSIVMASRHGERTVNEIAAQFPISRPAISKHLRILRLAGILSERRIGRHRYLRLAPKAVLGCGEWLLELAQGESSRRGEASAKTRRGDWAPYL